LDGSKQFSEPIKLVRSFTNFEQIKNDVCKHILVLNRFEGDFLERKDKPGFFLYINPTKEECVMLLETKLHIFRDFFSTGKDQ
jgi:hypothetical protein